MRNAAHITEEAAPVPMQRGRRVDRMVHAKLRVERRYLARHRLDLRADLPVVAAAVVVARAVVGPAPATAVVVAA